jgi:hypothetical protein
MNSRMIRIGFSRSLALAALGATFALVGCGNKAQDGTSTTMTRHKPRVETAVKKDSQAAYVAESSRMASAVVSGKTSAPVELRYELATKPAIGQPLEIELAFLPTAPADALEVAVSGMPGLTVASGEAIKFEKVQSGETYTHKFLVQASGSGTYYVSVIAKMVSETRTEVRTFSVPVVFGTVPAAQKPAPAKDANGEPIESMPATER